MYKYNLLSVEFLDNRWIVSFPSVVIVHKISGPKRGWSIPIFIFFIRIIVKSPISPYTILIRSSFDPTIYNLI